MSNSFIDSIMDTFDLLMVEDRIGKSNHACQL